MLKFAIAWAFLTAVVFSPSKHVFSMFFETTILRGIPLYQTGLFTILINYWIPAILIYLVLLFVHAERFLKPTRGMNVLFSVANWVMCIYSILRVWTSTIEGGGASFALVSLGIWFTFPALACLCICTVWLVIRSLPLTKGAPFLVSTSRDLNVRKLLALAALIPPFALFGWTYQSNTEAISKSRAVRSVKEARFAELCKQARIEVYRRVSPAKSVYFPMATNAFFSLFPVLEFAEERNGYQKDGEAVKYRRITKKPDTPARIQFSTDFNTQMVTEVLSEYEITTKVLEARADTELGFAVVETTILDRRNNEVLAVFTAVSERKSIATKSDKFCPSGFNSFTFETGVPAYVLGLMDEKAAIDFERKMGTWKKSTGSP